MPYSVLSCFSFKPPHDRESWAGCREVEDAEQVIISIIPTLASGRLIVVQVRWPLQLLYDFEDWLAVERQVDAELRIPFPKGVRILAVEF